MDPKTFERFLDEKVADAKHNLDAAAKKYSEAKAMYELVLSERDSFLNAIKEGEIKWIN